MLHPVRDVLRERSKASKELLQDSVEHMKKNEATGSILLHLREGEYTIAFLDGNLTTIVGPLTQTLDILQDRAAYGEISVFTVEKRIFNDYLGYLERNAPYTCNGIPLNNLLVDLVKKKHTGTIKVVNSSEEGLIFLIEGVPEIAFYSNKEKMVSGSEALEGIMKLAEKNAGITVYSAVKSTESLKSTIPIAEMKIRGLFFNALKSHIQEKHGGEGLSLFNKKVGRPRYFDLFMYPMEEFLRAAETARTILGCSEFELGKMIYADFKKSALGRLVFFMEDASTPSDLGRIAQMVWRSAVNYGERWIHEDTEGRVVLRVKNEGDTCEQVRGILAGAMESIGYKCEIKETECEKRGGRFCEFVIEWDPAQYK